MDKFPNTVFRIAGFLAITNESPGLAITILESLENEGHFFVQEVDGNKIRNFVEVDVFFVPATDSQSRTVGLGDEAIYCFLLPASIGRKSISKFDAAFGEKEDITILIEESIRAGALHDEALIEAAFVVGNEEVLRSSLDSQYFKMRRTHPRSAEFFRQNNILRSLVIFSLPTQRLQDLARRCHISFQESGNRIRVRFPESASQTERDGLERMFALQMKLSMSFSDSGTLIDFDDGAFADQIGIGEYANLVRFDLPFSRMFLASEGSRAIFVPVGLTSDMFDSLMEQGLNRDQTSYEEFVDLSLELLTDHDVDSSTARLIKEQGRIRAFDVETAVKVAAAMMMVARRRSFQEWRAFGRIRCCTFAIRRWGQGTLEGSDRTELFCIDAMKMRFSRSDMRRDIPFDAFFYLSRRGIVAPDNFSGVNFGLANHYSEFTVLAMHNLLR